MATENTIQELESLRNELLERVKQIEGTISMYKAIHNTADNALKNANIALNITKEAQEKYRGYDKKASMRNKIAVILKAEKRFLHVREIAKFIHEIDPFDNETEIAKKISPAISFLGKSGSVVKLKIGKSNINSFWGSKNWLDENGNPKVGHEYNKAYLVKSNDDKIEI